MKRTKINLDAVYLGQYKFLLICIIFFSLISIFPFLSQKYRHNLTPTKKSSRHILVDNFVVLKSLLFADFSPIFWLFISNNLDTANKN